MTHCHSNYRFDIAYLEGCIKGQKRIIEINSEGGLHKVCPDIEIKDKAYLQGLEDALSIMKGDR